MLSSHLSRCLALATAAFLAASCAAQVMQDPGTMPDGRQVHFPGAAQMKNHPNAAASLPQDQPHYNQAPPAQVKTGATVAAQPSTPEAKPAQQAVPPSLLDKPPQPATVTLSSGELAVKADNSSLSQILDQLASSSGMSIDGLNKDQRVFGSYGPGNPQQVLSALLDGAGYNVLMLGVTNDGAPRQLILTARSDTPIAPAQANQANSPDQQSDDDDNDNSDNNSVNFPERLTPVLPRTPPEAPAGGVKTPAQILQELQQLRQQQQQSLPPQNPQ